MSPLQLHWSQWYDMSLAPTVYQVMLIKLKIAFPGNIEGEVRNGGRYDAFPYKFHGYSKVSTLSKSYYYVG